MSNELKEWNNIPFKTWGYEGQTEMKHKAFSYYLPLWLRILGTFHGNLNFVDGFGGIGAYHTDKDKEEDAYKSNNYGSPVMSMKIIHGLTKAGRIKNANVIIIDKEQGNLDNVKTILEYNHLPTKNVIFKQGEFDNKINELLDYFEQEGKKLAPTFFLLDPFGFSGIKLSTIERIMKLERTEVLLNFMYNALQRWVTHPDKSIQKTYDEYFGGDEWRTCKEKKLFEREEEMISIFRAKCKTFASHVYPFKLCFPNKNKTYYYLFHLTNHYLGCALMKDSFAKHSGGKDTYVGENYQSSLFADIEEKEKREKFADKLINKYTGQTIYFIHLIEAVIDGTDLLCSEIRKVLAKLENDNKITVQPFPKRARRGGFEDRDKITFV